MKENDNGYVKCVSQVKYWEVSPSFNTDFMTMQLENKMPSVEDRDQTDRG